MCFVLFCLFSAVDFPRIFGVYDSQQMVWILKENSLIATPFSRNVIPGE